MESLTSLMHLHLETVFAESLRNGLRKDLLDRVDREGTFLSVAEQLTDGICVDKAINSPNATEAARELGRGLAEKINSKLEAALEKNPTAYMSALSKMADGTNAIKFSVTETLGYMVVSYSLWFSVVPIPAPDTNEMAYEAGVAVDRIISKALKTTGEKLDTAFAPKRNVPERRLRRLSISQEFLFSLLTAGQHISVYELVGDSVPKDARILEINLEHITTSKAPNIELLLESADFTPVPEGEPIPRLYPAFRVHTEIARRLGEQ